MRRSQRSKDSRVGSTGELVSLPGQPQCLGPITQGVGWTRGQYPSQIIFRGNRLGRQFQGSLILRDGIHHSTLLLKANRQSRMSVGMLGLDRQRGLTMSNRAIDFSFLKKSMGKPVMGDEVRRPNDQSFLVVTNRFVDPPFLEKSVGESDLSVRVVRLEECGFLAMGNCFVGLAFLEKGVAKIVLCISKVGLESQGGAIMTDRLIDLALLNKDNSQIVVSHPAIGISRQCGTPQRFDVRRHRTLPRSQNSQDNDRTDGRSYD